MSTFTIRISSSATNPEATAYGWQPDQGAPSYFDVVVSGSTNPELPDGVYDGFCLNPQAGIALRTDYVAQNYAGNTVASYVPIGFTDLTQAQVDQINWLLSQNFTSDGKYAGQFNFGEVQTAIWKLLGYSDAVINDTPQVYLTDNYRNVLEPADVTFLVDAARAAVASGVPVVPTDAFFATVIDPEGATQPLILQLQSAKLGNFVWQDSNANGVQDTNEAGVDNVVVELYDGQGQFITSTRTGDDFSTAAVEHGYYQFAGLKAGSYKVHFVAPTYNFTVQDSNVAGATDSNDSDANAATGFSQVVTLAAGESNQTIDAGLVTPPAPTASLGDRLWVDADGDGLQDDGEVGVVGATVTLIGGGADGLINGVGDTVATTTTGANGIYSFTGLNVGEQYQVQFTAPQGTVFTTANANNNGSDTLDSDANTATGRTQIVTLAAGENNTTLDAGVYVPVSIGDKVFEDKNADGKQGGNEPGIDGVKVRLFNCVTNLQVAETTTANGGLYSFAGLLPGTYHVVFETPNGFVQTVANVDGAMGTAGDAIDSDAGVGGVTGCYTLSSGQSNTTVDAGFYKLASLGDYVWADNNNNGVQDELPNQGLNGVTVNLLRADGTLVKSTTTGNDGSGNPGYYLFKDLVPGEYKVQFVPLAGYVFAKQDAAAATDTTDSDVSAASNGMTIVTTLESGENDLSWDAGLVKLASLGNRLWIDADADGIQDTGEAGVVSSTVTLIGGGADGLINGVGDTQVTTQTDANGEYRFNNLNVGEEYQVRFTAGAGYAFTQANANANGSDTVDSDANTTSGLTQIVTLAAGQYNDTLDAGLIQLRPGIDIEKTTSGSSNSNTTAANYDNEDTANGAGVPILTVGSDVTWTYKVTNTGNTSFAKSAIAVVDDNGTVGNTADDMSIANGKVTYQSGDSNNNSSLDAGETWFYKATGTVQALNGTGATSTFNFNGNTATDGTDGNVRSYTVDGITVNAEAWSRDKTSGAWAEAYLGAYGGGLGVTDSSEGDGASASSHTVDNTGRDNFIVLQFSQSVVIDKAYLGYVVNDSDLQMWVGNANSPITTMSNTVLNGLGFSEVNTTTLTGARMAELNAGNVAGNTIIIAADTTDTSPEDFFKLEQLVLQAATTGGVYANKATVTITGGPSDSDMSHYVTEAAKAKIGDRVWYDKDADGLQDAGEAGVAGVTIDLKDAVTKSVVMTTTTDANGYYNFVTKAGDYFIDVREATLPSGFVFTRPNVNNNGSDASDSDVQIRADEAGATLQWGQMVNTNLSAGETDLSWDAGVYKVGIDVEKYVSGTKTTSTNNGCGEGANVTYWKSNCTWQSSLGSNGWAETGVKSTLSFNSVFGCNVTGGTQSLYNVLCTTGTTAREVAMRECVAAYLNACHAKVDYAYGKEQVVAQTKWCMDNANYDSTCKSFQRENTLGCNWTTTKTSWSNVVDTQLYDADAPPGLEVKTGGTVTFTYIVKNTGDTALKDVVLTDDRIQTVTYVSGDTNNNGLLDTTETWTYTAKETASAGTIKNTGTVTAKDAVGGVAGVTDKDDAYYTGNGAAKSSLGDRVWEDKDFDGVQDAGEAGVAGVKVTLLGAGKDNTFNTADDITAVTTTNSLGMYEFNNLDAGKYKLDFDQAAGYFFTKQNLGGNDAADSDVDSTGKTVEIVLGANQHDLTVDAGIYRKASVGDKVWQDSNHNWLQDAGEAGIGNITVNLMDAAGLVVLKTTKTDTNGKYLFSELDPGTYVLQFDKTNVSYLGYNMSTWKWAVKDSGNNANDTIDSDVAGDGVATTNVSKTAAFTLASGQADMTRDAGITPIVIDLDGNGIQTVSREDAQGTFDLLGTGKAIASGWLSGGDGFLAVDTNGNGQIDGIGELFGGNSKGDGFAKLGSYDSNGDGLVNDLDAAFGQLMIWKDANGNHQTDAGELMTLAQAGVASLTVAYTELPQIDAQGNLHLERSTATMADGLSVAMTDVYFNVSEEDAAAAGVSLPSISDLLNSEGALDGLLGATPQSMGGLQGAADTAECGADHAEALRRLAALSRESCHAVAA